MAFGRHPRPVHGVVAAGHALSGADACARNPARIEGIDFMTDRDRVMPTEEQKDDFRRVMGRLASGVCVVTARWGAQDHAMTATAVASVSLEPLFEMFADHCDSRMRDALEIADKWALHKIGTASRREAEGRL